MFAKKLESLHEFFEWEVVFLNLISVEKSWYFGDFTSGKMFLESKNLSSMKILTYQIVHSLSGHDQLCQG